MVGHVGGQGGYCYETGYDRGCVGGSLLGLVRAASQLKDGLALLIFFVDVMLLETCA